VRYSDRVDARHVADARTSLSRELVQAYADDVVLAAAVFKPNAAGSHELTLGAGFGHRQLLKARGAYLGEHIVLGVTALHVHALALFFGGRSSRAVACWRRVDVRSELVAPRGRDGEGLWAALLLTDCHRNNLVELQVLHSDDDAWQVMTLLLRRDPSSAR
jgi:hypothetical protein